MPQPEDIDFGKRAVAERILSREKLDAALSLLHSLEQSGSSKRIWDVIAEKGWMTRGEIDGMRIRSQPGKPTAAPAKEDAPVFNVGTMQGSFIIAHVTAKDEPKLHRLPAKPMSVGRDKGCDIVLDESGVEKRHARITHTDRGPTIWDVGTENGVLVNGTRRTTWNLQSGDLVGIGQALLVALFEPQGTNAMPEPISSDAMEGGPLAGLVVENGARKGETFFLIDRPVVIGRHRLATIRLEDRRVSQLHAHLCAGESGVAITHLKGPFGLSVRDKTVSQAVLRDGDLIGVGDARLRFKLLREPSQPAHEEVEHDTVGGMPEIPAEADLERSEAARIADMHDVLLNTEKYSLGELVFNALEGPIKGQAVPIDKPRIVIGRGGVSQVVIPDPAVSRQHAAVLLSSDGVLEVEDLGSRNGISVNDRKVTKTRLWAGDVVKMGATIFTVDKLAK